MEALLDDLERDPQIARERLRARRIRWASAWAAMAFAGLGAFGIWRGLTRGERLCASGEEKFEGHWDTEVREAVRKAFSTSGRPYAQDTFERVAVVLDDFSRNWLEARRDACEAFHVRGERSQKWLDLQSLCLAKGLREMQALVEVLRQPDDTVIEKAVQAAMALAKPTRCAEIDMLDVRYPPPEDPVKRQTLDEIRRELATAKVLIQTGRSPEAEKVARGALGAAESLGWIPLEAETRLTLGMIEREADHADDAERLLDRAWVMAQDAGDRALEAECAIELASVVGFLQARYEEGHRLMRFARAVISTLENRDALLADWYLKLGTLEFEQSHFEKSIENDSWALSLTEKLLGPHHPQVGKLLNNLGTAYDMLNNLPKAIEQHRRALAIWQKTLGPSHPRVGETLNNLGNVYLRQRDFAKAIKQYEAALAILEPSLGAESPRVARIHHNIGLVLLSTPDPDQALFHFRHALWIKERNEGRDHPSVAHTLSAMGEAYLLQRHFLEGLQAFERAQDIAEARYDEQNPFRRSNRVGIARAHLGLGRFADVPPILESVLPALEAHPADPEELAHARFCLGQALWSLGKQRERALDLVRRARDGLTAADTGNPLVGEMQRWLAQRGSPPAP